ncbi:hypothetical protein TNCV_1200091 [Trichonephila clavipes]|uniref:Uncharacterized protein n=1 Tax=Trichonephila clavipes TaxID=2585209 RepID=A0A8X6S1U2_TRICX|nr:hypothetical protein TNCV_1200091 [Trichonephila clavipes]
MESGFSVGYRVQLIWRSKKKRRGGPSLIAFSLRSSEDQVQTLYKTGTKLIYSYKIRALIELDKQEQECRPSSRVVGDADSCALGPGLESRRKHGCGWKGRREAGGPGHPQSVLPQNWGGSEPDRTATCIVLKAKANDRRKILALSRDEFRRPRSDSVGQVSLVTTRIYVETMKPVETPISSLQKKLRSSIDSSNFDWGKTCFLRGHEADKEKEAKLNKNRRRRVSDINTSTLNDSVMNFYCLTEK